MISTLIKEYVQLKTRSLIEEDAAGDQYYGDSSHGMYSAGSAEKNMDIILSIFGIKSLQNIGRVALGVGEAIITRVFGELYVFAQRLWHLINPYYWAESSEDLNALTQQTRASIEGRISRASAGYADVMRDDARVIERMSPDLNFAMFLANPAAAIASSATSETAGGVYNIYHRIRYGGPPGTSGTNPTGTDATLAAQRTDLINRARAVDSTTGGGGNTLQAVARTILGNNATDQDVNELLSSSGMLTEAGGAVPEDDENRASSVPNRTAPRVPTMAPAAPRPIAASNDPRVQSLINQARQLNQNYVNFLKSSEAQSAILNNPGVKEGQAALVDIVVNNYRNQVRDLTFERMRSEHPEEFERIEREARESPQQSRTNSRDTTSTEENTAENETEDTETSDNSEEEEQSGLFDTEEKRNAFVSYAKQQLAVPSIAQLQTLAQQTPELRTAVDTGIRQIQTLASAR